LIANLDPGLLFDLPTGGFFVSPISTKPAGRA